jgi:hypothetical protein
LKNKREGESRQKVKKVSQKGAQTRKEKERQRVHGERKAKSYTEKREEKDKRWRM